MVGDLGLRFRLCVCVCVCVCVRVFSSLQSLQALQNTKMLAAYASMDERVRPLGYAVKHMAKVMGTPISVFMTRGPTVAIPIRLA